MLKIETKTLIAEKAANAVNHMVQAGLELKPIAQLYKRAVGELIIDVVSIIEMAEKAINKEAFKQLQAPLE